MYESSLSSNYAEVFFVESWIRKADDSIMRILQSSPLLIAGYILITTSLPEDLFLVSDTPQPETFDTSLNSDISDSRDFIFDSGLNADDINLFSIASEDDLTLVDILASTQSQSSCQADNDLINTLQNRDTDTSICGPQKNDAPLNLPLDLFNDPTGFLRENLPPEESDPDREVPTDGLFDRFSGRKKPKKEEVPIFVSKCEYPFINVCCNGPLGVVDGDYILNIFDCALGTGFCDREFEACCLLYVSGPSFN